jgi:hypothetical protein
MKFLIGLILGSAISVGMMSRPELRHQLLSQVTQIVEKAKLLSRKPNPPVDAGDIPPLVVLPVADTAEEVTDTVNSADTAQVTNEPRPVETVPEYEAEEEFQATSVIEDEDIFVATAASMFQVAWSPFRSETSAKGFAARLERQISREFQVIKTGPGRYEVGFLFESDPERTDVLKAINEITGFESSAPPRIVKI